MLDRDKKKELAPDCAAYYPFGVDIFLSQRKIDHIARFVELPVVNVDGDVPSILVVNVQVPTPVPFFSQVSTSYIVSQLNFFFSSCVEVERCCKL